MKASPTVELASRIALWWMDTRPLSKEARERRQKRRAARRKARKGEPLTPEEEALMAKEKSIVKLPDGTVVERTEPTIPLRTSSKVALTILTPLITALPFYDEINGVLLQACQAEQGPTLFLGGFLVAGGLSYIAARFSKSPANPGKL